MIIKEDLGIYTDIYDTGKVQLNTKKHLYHAKCKICGQEVERLLCDIRKSKKCCHNKQHLLNGYIELYLPDHPRAMSNGCVYEHILVAEKKLGRQLYPGETVHHINYQRDDNREENLMVFSTIGDHTRFHSTGIAIQNEDGTYYSPIQNICIDCGKPIYSNSTRCANCEKIRRSKNIPSKEKLEELLKSNSMSAIGRLYGVSGNAVKKWKKKYEL